jgi:hypothetical protein
MSCYQVVPEEGACLQIIDEGTLSKQEPPEPLGCDAR